jgi:hypothetical protein
MKRAGSNAAVFEVPLARKEEMLRLSNLLKTETTATRYEIEVDGGNGSNNKVGPVDPRERAREEQQLSEVVIREALRRRKELEVEVKGLSNSIKEQELADFLKERKIQFVNLKVPKGNSKS